MADQDLTALRAKAEAVAPFYLPVASSVVLALLDRVEKAENDVKTLEDEMACFEEEERMADDQSEMDRRRLREQEAEIARLRSLLARAGEAIGFYRDGFAAFPNRSKLGIGGLEYRPTEALLDDCGNLANDVAREIEEAIGHE